MRVALLAVIFGCCVGLSAQNSPSSSASSPTTGPSTTAPSSTTTPAAHAQPSSSSSSNSQKQDSAALPDSSSGASAAKPAYKPNLEPPRSDRVNASSLEDGESSSKDTQIDLSPPPEDAKAHRGSSDVLVDEGSGTNTNGFRYWDPHKAAKNVEVGDFYFKRKNYKAAEDRYREALLYKANDAIATFRLAQCLDKMQRSGEAQEEYEAYLKILPNGQESEQAKKALARLKGSK